MYLDPQYWTTEELMEALAKAKHLYKEVLFTKSKTLLGQQMQKEQIASIEDQIIAYQICLNELNNVQDASTTKPFWIV